MTIWLWDLNHTYHYQCCHEGCEQPACFIEVKRTRHRKFIAIDPQSTTGRGYCGVHIYEVQ